MTKAVFLDRDGTINVEKNYLYRVEDFVYLDGVKEGLKKLQDAGYLLIIVTNQSGIGRGYYTEEEYQVLTEWMLEDLKKDSIIITDVYHCPHHREAVVDKYRKECDCRKPNIGLFMEACEKYQIDLNVSFAIGDKERDVAICDTSGVQGYVLYSEKCEKGNKHFISGGLLEASHEIINREIEG